MAFAEASQVAPGRAEVLGLISYRLLVVDVEPVELAEEDEVKPDSSCWWLLRSLFCLLLRIIKMSARINRKAMASVRELMIVINEFVLKLK